MLNALCTLWGFHCNRSRKKATPAAEFVVFPPPRHFGNAASSVITAPPGLRDMRIVPNPFTGQFVLRIAATQTGPLTAQLRDLSGRTVQNFAPVTVSPGENEIPFRPASDLPSGLYLLLVNMPEGASVLKVVRE